MDTSITRNNILKPYEREKKATPTKVTRGGVTGSKGRGKLKGATIEEVVPTTSTSPLGRILPPQAKKVSPQGKEAPKQGTPVLQKPEKGGTFAPVRSEKPLPKVYVKEGDYSMPTITIECVQRKPQYVHPGQAWHASYFKSATNASVFAMIGKWIAIQ